MGELQKRANFDVFCKVNDPLKKFDNIAQFLHIFINSEYYQHNVLKKTFKKLRYEFLRVFLRDETLKYPVIYYDYLSCF